jgi:parallel beta-helix repeat protein
MLSTGNVPGAQVGALRRWARRLVPPLFVFALLASAVITVRSDLEGHGFLSGAKVHFDHSYPADPVVNKPTFPLPAPPQPKQASVVQGALMGSFGELSRHLPRGVLTPFPQGGWILRKPVALSDGAKLVVSHATTLRIAPGAFLLTNEGAKTVLMHLNIVGVDASGSPATAVTPDRGFITQDERGVMVLRDDTLSYLGHYGSLAYGVSFSKAGHRSRVVDCRITHDYIGLYATESRGVVFSGNSISRSTLYGIDPHTRSSELLIENNTVTDSGLHGIILAQNVSRSRVIGNTIDGAVQHGIVLYDHSDADLVSGNHISNTFDGIVLQGSSANTIVGNTVTGVQRFAVRVGGTSSGLVSTANTIQSDLLSNGLVGIYVYQGSTGNRFLSNRFVGLRENVRIRTDAPHNSVSPSPPDSELIP